MATATVSGFWVLAEAAQMKVRRAREKTPFVANKWTLLRVSEAASQRDTSSVHGDPYATGDWGDIGEELLSVLMSPLESELKATRRMWSAHTQQQSRCCRFPEEGRQPQIWATILVSAVLKISSHRGQQLQVPESAPLRLRWAASLSALQPCRVVQSPWCGAVAASAMTGRMPD
eukprot:6196708-Pleurochrysis_carterae.AAC.1